MNKAKAQQAIETLISNFHKRIGGKAVRRQYEPARHQIATLTDLGLIDLMPTGFGHGDAKVVIEAATATTGGFNAYGEGETWSNALQDAMNETDEDEDKPKVGDRVKITNTSRYQHLKVDHVVKPAIEHEQSPYVTTIVEILEDIMEDEHFNPVTVLTYVMKSGEHFSKDEFVIIS